MNTKTVLIADDEPHIRRLIEFTLRKAGFSKFLFAQNGAEALAIVGRRQVDLITLDQRMPELNGLDVLLRLKAVPSSAHIPVIMISACGSFHLDHNVKALGAYAVLTKPYSPMQLITEVRHALNIPDNIAA